MTEIGLSLGSNLGRRLASLRRARTAIAALPGVTLAASAPVYDTAPVGVAPADRRRRFLNTVLIIRSRRPVQELAPHLHAIERDLGRRRGGRRNAPREIDIDVVFAGRRRLCSPELTVPHPRWAARRYVVQPLADVRPDLRIPGQKLTAQALLLTLPPRPNVVLYRRAW